MGWLAWTEVGTTRAMAPMLGMGGGSYQKPAYAGTGTTLVQVLQGRENAHMTAPGMSPAAGGHSLSDSSQDVSGFPVVAVAEAAGPAGPGIESPARRQELAAFLRARRGRIRPDEVGLVPGPRRRTPGLRREEVAQLAGVGVTWYTWIEQGRPIHASVDVLDAIARTLRLDTTERDHLFRLADVTPATVDQASSCLDPEVQVILDRLAPLPASVLNSRYDMLAWNRPYEALFPGLVHAVPAERNVLWQIFTSDTCAVMNRDDEIPKLVATLRGAYARHVGEPAWTTFVERLSAASQQFAELWARHEVAEPVNRIKRFRALDGEELVMYATILAVNGTPEARMVVYTPFDERTSEHLDRQWAQLGARTARAARRSARA